ncbi:FAD-dependent monooxygenase [Saccharospirillum mangrovi]|uniref:FAD-dependent monooxygenase n=1 Tax=Saccharospirillum mangrovi TaxID=2161747 RepID=UPI000D333C2D|nr:FAD-dependent monooxygenase [Saccharospirillum mangrovi]
MPRYDIAIVGGGLVGLTLAIALEPALRAGARLTLIDPAPQPETSAPRSPSFDDRATALSAYTQSVYQRLGVWPLLEQYASPIRWIEVSDRGHLGYHQMDSADFDGDFGAVVANANLGLGLWQRARELDGLDWRFGDSVSALKPGQDAQQLTLNSGADIDARLVILCDGGRSPLAAQLGLSARQTDYNGWARIATVRTETPHNGRAYERFTEAGPIALLPFGDYSALVWTLSDSRRRQLDALSHDAQLALLNESFGQRLGRITELGNAFDYPLVKRELLDPVRPRLLALGNAAATLHPVAGQGYNLAIRGLMRAAERLNQALLNQNDPGVSALLQPLAADIAGDQRLTATFSDSLVRTFASSNPLLQLGRNLGLNLLDRHPSLSRSFVLASMGLSQGAPLPEAQS